MIGRIASVLFALAVAGCATPFKSIPKADDDFRLPPEEFTKRFSDVRAYSGEYGSPPVFRFSVAEELINAWGPPNQSEVNHWQQIGTTASIGGVALWITGGAPQIFIPLSAIVGYMQVTRPPEILTWRKGNYVVDVHAIKDGAVRHVSFWDWRHESAGTSAPLFSPPAGFSPIFKLNFLFGARFFETDFNANDPGLSGGLSLGAGVRHSTLVPNTDTEISVGMRTNGNYDSDTNQQIIARSTVIEALALYRVAESPMRIGGGVSAHINGKFSSNYLPDENIDRAMGVIGQFDYALWPRSAVGLRFESLRYQTTSGRELNANTIGLTNTMVFW